MWARMTLLPEVGKAQRQADPAKPDANETQLPNALSSAMPGVSPRPGGRRSRSGAGGHVGGQDVIRMAVEVYEPGRSASWSADRQAGQRPGRALGPWCLSTSWVFGSGPSSRFLTGQCPRSPGGHSEDYQIAGSQAGLPLLRSCRFSTVRAGL
jgi:hypothetical protein